MKSPFDMGSFTAEGRNNPNEAPELIPTSGENRHREAGGIRAGSNGQALVLSRAMTFYGRWVAVT